MGPLFLIMCLTNIKYIGQIYYPRNWDSFIAKQIIFQLKISLLDKLILMLSFKGSKKLNYIIMLKHARRSHNHKTDVRCI